MRGVCGTDVRFMGGWLRRRIRRNFASLTSRAHALDIKSTAPHPQPFHPGRGQTRSGHSILRSTVRGFGKALPDCTATRDYGGRSRLSIPLVPTPRRSPTKISDPSHEIEPNQISAAKFFLTKASHSATTLAAQSDRQWHLKSVHKQESRFIRQWHSMRVAPVLVILKFVRPAGHCWASQQWHPARRR